MLSKRNLLSQGAIYRFHVEVWEDNPNAQLYENIQFEGMPRCAEMLQVI